MVMAWLLRHHRCITFSLPKVTINVGNSIVCLKKDQKLTRFECFYPVYVKMDHLKCYFLNLVVTVVSVVWLAGPELAKIMRRCGGLFDGDGV
jgi:hypothetical protein